MYPSTFKKDCLPFSSSNAPIKQKTRKKQQTPAITNKKQTKDKKLTKNLYHQGSPNDSTSDPMFHPINGSDHPNKTPTISKQKTINYSNKQTNKKGIFIIIINAHLLIPPVTPCLTPSMVPTTPLLTALIPPLTPVNML